MRLKGSGRKGLPVTVSYYGDGPRPRIAPAGTTIISNDGPVSWWHLKGLDIAGATAWDPWGRTGGRTAGIAFRHSTPSEGLVIENCVIHDVDGPGIAFHAEAGGTETVYTGWRVVDCDVFHASTGITCGGPWPAGPDPFHYHRDFAVAGCRTHDIGTDGIVLSHCRQGVIERSTAWRTGIGRTRRTPVGIWFFQAFRCVIQYCESYDNHTAGGRADGGGFDFDGGAIECLMQYNYSHDNDGAGYLICSYEPVNAPCKRCVTRFNLSVNDGRANDFASILFWQAVECKTYNNTCITKAASAVKFISETGGHLVANNLFVVDSRRDIPVVKSPFPLGLNEFRNNLYWRTGGKARFEVPGNRNGAFADYLKETGGTGEICANPRLSALSGPDIRLLRGSPALGAGLRLKDMGSRDLYGTALAKSGPAGLGAALK